MDGYSDHNEIQECIDGKHLCYIHVITLTPNVKSRHKLMDQGIIAWTKNKYRYDLIWDLLEIYCDEGKKQRQFPVDVARVMMESDRFCIHIYMMLSQGWIVFGMWILKKTL